MVSVRSRPSLGHREPLAPSIAGRLRPHRRPTPPGLRQQPPCDLPCQGDVSTP